MIRFIEDLGIIPNKGKSFENDQSLKQGQKMMEYGRVYNLFNMERMKEIESNTYPSKKDNVKTITESMDTIESSSQSKSNVVLENTLSIHETEFYRLLAEYSNTSKVLTMEMIEHKDSDHTLLFNKLTRLYNSLLSISSLIEKELDNLQSISDKKLAKEFSNKKSKLARRVKKLKENRKKIGEEYLEIEEENMDEEKKREETMKIIEAIVFTIGLIILISLTIYQVFFNTNSFYLYIIFLVIVSILVFYNNS